MGEREKLLPQRLGKHSLGSIIMTVATSHVAIYNKMKRKKMENSTPRPYIQLVATVLDSAKPFPSLQKVLLKSTVVLVVKNTCLPTQETEEMGV